MGRLSQTHSRRIKALLTHKEDICWFNSLGSGRPCSRREMRGGEGSLLADGDTGFNFSWLVSEECGLPTPALCS